MAKAVVTMAQAEIFTDISDFQSACCDCKRQKYTVSRLKSCVWLVVFVVIRSCDKRRVVRRSFENLKFSWNELND